MIVNREVIFTRKMQKKLDRDNSMLEDIPQTVELKLPKLKKRSKET